MPGMTMDFTIDEAVSMDTLPVGEDVKLLLRQNPDFSMTLVGTAGIAPLQVTQ